MNEILYVKHRTKIERIHTTVLIMMLYMWKMDHKGFFPLFTLPNFLQKYLSFRIRK